MSEARTEPAIRRLDDSTVEKIAAGEVVTRPSRVVAELIENSLDAGSTRIDVAVEGDGTALIRVADDGCGMTATDAALAVQHHTTSKIENAADVERIETLGFRGEALPSIAAAGHLTLTTNDGGARGTRVTVTDGDPTVDPAGRGVGTTVEVRDLFHDRPARRKSLSSPKAEFARISELVSHYALVRPDVRFSLTHDGRETFSTPGSDRFADTILGVYDRTVASRSTTFEHETILDSDATGSDDAPELDASDPSDDRHASRIRVDGLLVYPSITRSKRDHVHVAVNGRALSDERIRRATVAGYGSLLPGTRAPIAVVRVDLPTELVDHNVHPAKAAVTFQDPEAVETAVETAVEDALTTADLRRVGAVAMDLDSSLEPLDGESVFETATVIGQYRGLYVLCEADGDLLVVDQHAAHERINFERLQAALPDGVPSVELDPPETVSLPPPAAAVAAAHQTSLARLGFGIEPFGGDTVRVTRLPAPLGRVADTGTLYDALDALRAGDPDDVREDLLADLACHPSLKAGDVLTTDEAETLLKRLGNCEQPYACPHGRPTVLSIEEETLVRGFGRERTRLG